MPSRRPSRAEWFVLGLLLLAAPAAKADDGAVRKVLDAQVSAWNRGDIPGFMETYAPDVVFAGREITRGAAQLKERYERRYPTPEKMGRLAFELLESRPVGDSAAYAIGRWKLDRSEADGGPAGGIFSLVLERRGGKWLIVMDHTQ